MASDWMKSLSQHYETACQRYQGQRLMLLSDIDGTILDMRHMIFAVLQSFDREHQTNYFERLQAPDITVHENQVDQLIRAMNIPKKARQEILGWYLAKRWTPEAVLEMHRPFRGVLDVIRWFQLQPNTYVGLVSGRPESLRADTLRSLNQLGEPYRVMFTEDLLYMNPGEWEQGVPGVKVAGLEHFQQQGYHVFAFIDNEPSNLKALDAANAGDGVLLLHANTIFESKRTRVPRGTVRGNDYRLAELIPNEKALPSHVQLAWHGVNDRFNLQQFLSSDVRWVEVDVRLDPSCQKIILRHDSFAQTPLRVDETWLTLDEVLDQVIDRRRAVKIDLKAGGMLLDQVLTIAAAKGIQDQDLWFNANIEALMARGFKRLAHAHPDAIIQCPIDFLAPLIVAAPSHARGTLQMFREWGINRFSISWQKPDLRALFDQMDKWGYEVNIYNVPDLESFLQAILILPRSVTADFNFPKWNYYGHGSGARRA